MQRKLPDIVTSQSLRRVCHTQLTRLLATMPKATWNGVTIAESNKTEVVEGNQYFPPDSLKQEYFKPTDTTTVCGWKGTASYYTISAGGKDNKDAAWTYRTPKSAAANIKDYVAFWRGVKVEG